jgi:CheY-like chemotaxis protein
VVVSAVKAMDAAIDAGADAFLRKPIDPPPRRHQP